jgi:phage tail sheath gpL-like
VTIAVPGVPASRKTPGVAFNVILGGAGTSAGDAPISIMLLGNKSAAVSVSSPTYAQAAGTAAVDTVVSIASSDDAATMFGLGSELHIMSLAVFAQQPNAALFGCAVTEAGTAGTAVLTFVTSASAAGTVRLSLCGNIIDVPVASGDSVTTIASNVCTYVNTVTSLPYYAQNSAGVVTFTAKNTGPRANVLVVDAYFIASGAVVPSRILAASATSSGFSTTGQWTTSGTLGAEFTVTGGATQDSFANVLAAIEPQRYGRIVGACIDATNAGRISTALASQAGPTIQILEQGIVPSVDTYSNAVTFASALNAARMQTAWHHASPLPPPAIAAQVAAARVAGDGAIGGDLVGEGDDPAANLNGVQLATITVQRSVSDQPTATEIENALNNGLTPLAPSSTRPGFVEIVKSITTRASVANVPNYAVLGTQNVTVPDYTADTLRSSLRTAYRGAKLRPDTTDGLPPRIPRVVTPSIVRAFIAQILQSLEDRGILINVAANLSLLVVEINATNSSRLDCEIPAAVIPGLDIIAGNVRQL